jgi:hypothetical protein
LKKIISVYKLLGQNNDLFYIGLTKNPEKRLRSHKRKYGKDIHMQVFYQTWDMEEANKIEKECIANAGVELTNSSRGGGYNARFYNDEQILSDTNSFNSSSDYIPLYLPVLRATHLRNRQSGVYEPISPTSKVVLMYLLHKYKSRNGAGGYTIKQEDVARDCAVVRRSVYSLIKSLDECGYLKITAKQGTASKNNAYLFTSEFELAVIDKGYILDEFTTDVLQVKR